MKNKLAATGSIIGALLLAAAATSPAHAVDASNRACSTTEAAGSIKVENWTGPDATVKIHFKLTNHLTHGHNARIRLVSKETGDKLKTWPWHRNVGGSGTTNTWASTASDDRGLFEIGVQVARFSGDTFLNSCTDWDS